ncbi:adenylate/guanylate cyclase domain-containing protein [Leptospira sp. GIMC2001]|uniref:adenylate/guanylate cyclase domain-containing protein n=1 Tax=Leptospira sp. GIMC2001 TaxID=1513297 RepID=UPI00234ABF7D|nr:adenylate/guanylate cyclase domain-containing protein [Leptospira sp. GIMC2001]WCL49719.1 adenylate/guanylate cyclase domain-containing protein [Leptospira sp. GIMC2001]
MDILIKSHFFDWLYNTGIKVENPRDYFYEYIQFLNEHDYGITRVSLGGSALHPEIESIGYTFSEKQLDSAFPAFVTDSLLVGQDFVNYPKGSITTLRFRVGIRLTDAFKNSPIPALWSDGAPIYIPISAVKDESVADPYPIITDLREAGCTCYFAMPLATVEGIRTYASFSSTRPGAFTEEMIENLRGMTEIFTTGWYSFRLRDMTKSLMSLYLGEATSKQVLAGKIRRGDVEKMEAVIWFSDIRKYSELSSQYPPEDLIRWLNEYYDDQIANIHKFGGEVLKIMGDGILAVFPTIEGRNIKTNARRALVASLRSMKILDERNLTKKSDEVPEIHHGIALHQGLVEYGNIGSSDRLDFTIIGSDVNITARISNLCSGLSERILLSSKMSQLIPGHLRLVDQKVTLKGILEPQDIYAP